MYFVDENVTSKHQIIYLATKRFSAQTMVFYGIRHLQITVVVNENAERISPCKAELLCKADFEVKVVTKDPDSSASRATDSLFKERLYKVKPTHFMDMDSIWTFVRKYQEIYKIKSETVKESCYAEQKLRKPNFCSRCS